MKAMLRSAAKHKRNRRKSNVQKAEQANEKLFLSESFLSPFLINVYLYNENLDAECYGWLEFSSFHYWDESLS